MDDERFGDRRKKFESEYSNLFTVGGRSAVGVRVTGVPLVDIIKIDRVFRHRSIVEELKEEWRKVFRSVKGGAMLEAEVDEVLSESLFWRPMLRVARGDHSSYFVNRKSISPEDKPIVNHYREVHCDGLVELGYTSIGYLTDAQVHLGNYTSVVLLANLMVQVSRVRKLIGDDAVYDLEVQIRHWQGEGKSNLLIGPPGPRHRSFEFESDSITFPRYSFVEQTGWEEILKTHYRDLFHFLEQDRDDDKDKWLIENWPL